CLSSQSFWKAGSVLEASSSHVIRNVPIFMQPGDTTGDTKTGKCSVSRNAKGNRSYSRAADHGTRFFNAPNLTSSVKRRLSALTRRRFFRSVERRAMDPTADLV